MSNEETRVSQVSDGFKTGIKKGALRTASEKLAGAISSHIPANDKFPVKKLSQLAILLAASELVERAPNGAASKVGLTEERRASFGNMSRTLGGEILGKDVVELFSTIAPTIMEKLTEMSASDIMEVAESEEVAETH